MTTNNAISAVSAAIVDAMGKVETLRAAVESLRATLPGGKFADKAAYADARKVVTDAAVAAGYSPAAIRATLTRAGFTTLNPDLKVRGKAGGRKATKAADKKTAAAAPNLKLSAAELELLEAYRRHDAAKLRSIADTVAAENANTRRK